MSDMNRLFRNLDTVGESITTGTASVLQILQVTEYQALWRLLHSRNPACSTFANSISNRAEMYAKN